MAHRRRWLLPVIALLVLLFSPATLRAQAPVQLALVDEGLDSAGRWFQRFRLTIGPGGSLTAASELLFGDQTHVDELFAAARQANPGLGSPSNVPVGQQMLLTIDPRTTYVIRERSVDQAQQVRRFVYTNGAQRTVYVGTRTGVLQEIVFASDRPARTFMYADGQGRFTVSGGGRLLDYAYPAGERFQDVVKAIYGEAAAQAMQDFIAQSAWDPNRWPPPPDERRRFLLGPAEQYRDVRPALPSLEAIPDSQREALRQQLETHAQLGARAVAFDGTRLTYRVQVTDPAVSAKRLTAALYGGEGRWLAVARAAGLETEQDHVKGLPPGADPTLLGRSFDLTVDLADQYFPVGAVRQEGSSRVVTLRNGTVVEDLSAERGRGSGVTRIVRYPGGYKRITYRPDPLWLFGLDFLHFQAGFLRGATKDESARDREGRAFAAQVLWSVLRDLPRERDDEPMSLIIGDAEREKVLEVVTRPRPPRIEPSSPWAAAWQQQPIIVAIGATLVTGLLLVVVFGVVRRPLSLGARIPLARRRITRR